MSKVLQKIKINNSKDAIKIVLGRMPLAVFIAVAVFLLAVVIINSDAPINDHFAAQGRSWRTAGFMWHDARIRWREDIRISRCGSRHWGVGIRCVAGRVVEVRGGC